MQFNFEETNLAMNPAKSMESVLIYLPFVSLVTCSSQPPNPGAKSKKGRSRFNSVLKECESLLQTMGLQCVQAPGEAEAYCAHLNMNGVTSSLNVQ